MTDRDTWDNATAKVAAEFSQLSAGRKSAVADAADAIKACKTCLHDIVAAVGAGAVCTACGGACCMNGKYHFTVVELLVYLVDRKELFAPRFGQGVCPYVGSEGCLMAPAYRPFTCVIFNCDQVENRLDPLQKERLYRLEGELRGLYTGLEKLFGRRFSGGMLMDGAGGDLLGGETFPGGNMICEDPDRRQQGDPDGYHQ
jgi:hypothetical protein